MEKNILEEYKERLKELQKPVDNKDLGSATLVDRRLSTIREKYSDDEEGYLLSELDKRRTEEHLNISKIQEIIEKIKAVRESKKEEEIKNFVAEIKQEQKELIRKIHNKNKQVEEMKQQSGEQEAEIRKMTQEISDNNEYMKKRRISGKQTGDIYANIINENKELISAKLQKFQNINKNKMKKEEIEGEIAQLNESYAQFDEILTLAGVTDLDKAAIEMQEEVKKEEEEKELAEQAQTGLEQGDSKDADEKLQTEQGVEEKENTVSENGEVKNTNQIQVQAETTTERKKIKHVGRINEDGSIKKPECDKVEKVGMYINDAGVPSYYAIIRKTDGTEERFEPENQSFENILKINNQNIDELKSKGLVNRGIFEAEKYYDIALAKVLEQADIKYGTLDDRENSA